MPTHSQPRCTAARTAPRMTAFRPGASPPPARASVPAFCVRWPVSLGALAAVAWGATGYAPGRVAAGPGFWSGLAALGAAGALTRRYGVPLPGNGFSSYVLGVVAVAALDRRRPLPGVGAAVPMLGGALFL